MKKCFKNIKKQEKQSGKSTRITISTLIGIIGCLIAGYSILKPNIKMVKLSPNTLPLHFEQSNDGKIYAFAGDSFVFVNKSIKSGFIKDVKVVCDALNPTEYKSELVEIDESLIYPFQTKNIFIKSRLIYNNLALLNKSSSFTFYFYDNNGEIIMQEKAPAPAYYKTCIVHSIDNGKTWQ